MSCFCQNGFPDAFLGGFPDTFPESFPEDLPDSFLVLTLAKKSELAAMPDGRALGSDAPSTPGAALTGAVAAVGVSPAGREARMSLTMAAEEAKSLREAAPGDSGGGASGTDDGPVSSTAIRRRSAALIRVETGFVFMAFRMNLSAVPSLSR